MSQLGHLVTSCRISRLQSFVSFDPEVHDEVPSTCKAGISRISRLSSIVRGWPNKCARFHVFSLAKQVSFLPLHLLTPQEGYLEQNIYDII